MDKLLILGAGGFGQMVKETAVSLGYGEVVFLDDAAKGADVIGIATQSHGEALAALVDSALTIPDTHPMFLPSLEVIPMQLFAYYVALMRGCDIDKPRNLAKSVTVE